MAGIKKTDFSAIKKKFSKEAEYKPDRFFDLGDAFLDACGIGLGLFNFMRLAGLTFVVASPNSPKN